MLFAELLKKFFFLGVFGFRIKEVEALNEQAVTDPEEIVSMVHE